MNIVSPNGKVKQCGKYMESVIMQVADQNPMDSSENWEFPHVQPNILLTNFLSPKQVLAMKKVEC